MLSAKAAKMLKLCGFTEPTSLQVAIDCRVDFVGLVFVPNSIRMVNAKQADVLAKIIPANVAKVAVVNDLSIQFLQSIWQACKPDFWQIHGNFAWQDLLLLKTQFPQTKIISAFNLASHSDLAKINTFSQVSDYFLLDSASSGAGKNFSWQWLETIQLNKPIILAGGINCGNLAEACKVADILDISSGIEEQRGIKSAMLIRQTINLFKNLCNHNLR
jgi:phosphoribosylanthranilate isomerase